MSDGIAAADDVEYIHKTPDDRAMYYCEGCGAEGELVPHILHKPDCPEVSVDE
jgi:hypothetical protein